MAERQRRRAATGADREGETVSDWRRIGGERRQGAHRTTREGEAASDRRSGGADRGENFFGLKKVKVEDG